MVEQELCVVPAPVNEALVLKPIELVNIGHLQKESTFLNCPACQDWALSEVRLEAVTCLQRLLELTDWWKNWAGRHDINHYCGKCGCYIGRYVDIECIDSRVTRRARCKAAKGVMELRKRPKDIAEHMQEARLRAKARRACKAQTAEGAEGAIVVE